MEALNWISSQTTNESIWHKWSCVYTQYYNSYYIYMSISISNKWFTLAELLIIIALIGMLAAGLYPSLTGYLARWRDSTKITEIAQLNTALVLYQVANKTYGVQWTGWMGWWQWWMNMVETGSPISILEGLQNKWFLNKSIQFVKVSDSTNPPVIYNTLPCGTASSSQNIYMLYFDDSVGKYSISGYLENPLPPHIANIQLSWNGMWSNWTCEHYGRNYAVGIN
jgi:type II secretory pathway pseudopilin PulG